MCKKNSRFAKLNHLSSKIYYIFQIYNNYYWELYFARHSSSHTIAKSIIHIKRLWNIFFRMERSGYLSFYQKQVFCTVLNFLKIQNQENTSHLTVSVLWCTYCSVQVFWFSLIWGMSNMLFCLNIKQFTQYENTWC